MLSFDETAFPSPFLFKIMNSLYNNKSSSVCNYKMKHCKSSMMFALNYLKLFIHDIQPYKT